MTRRKGLAAGEHTAQVVDVGMSGRAISAQLSAVSKQKVRGDAAGSCKI